MSDEFFNLNGEPINKDSESTPNANSSQEQNYYNQNPYESNQNPYSQNPYENGQNPYSQNPYGNSQGQNQDTTNNGSNYNYGQNPYGAPNNGQNPYNYSPNMGTPQKQGPNSLAITAFVLSLVAPLLCCCSSYGIILSAIACIASIVLAFVSKQKKPFHGLAIAALIISFIYLAILIFFVICVIIVFSNPDMMGMYEEFYNDMYNDLYGGYEFDLFRFIKF